jgi:ankyrin repeat protein
MANNAEGPDLSLIVLFRGQFKFPSIAAVQALIDKGANVNTKDVSGDSVLHLAILRGHLDAVLMLLAEEGIDICAKNNCQSSAFM